VVVVVVAVDDHVGGPVGQGLGRGPEVLPGLGREEAVVDQRSVAEVDDAGVADGRATGDVDDGVDAIRQLLEVKAY
jgi:hypothetical protein